MDMHIASESIVMKKSGGFKLTSPRCLTLSGIVYLYIFLFKLKNRCVISA